MTDRHDIRKMLVDGIRNNPNNPDKPRPLKDAAELLISTIDHIERHGEDYDSRRAFQQNYARLVRVAGLQ